MLLQFVTTALSQVGTTRFEQRNIKKRVGAASSILILKLRTCPTATGIDGEHSHIPIQHYLALENIQTGRQEIAETLLINNHLCNTYLVYSQQ